MDQMEEEEDSPIEPSSLEYIEDSYVPNLELNATPSLDDLAAYDCDDLDDIYDTVTWSKETDLFLRSLTLDQILTIPDELSVIDENIEMQSVEFSDVDNSHQNNALLCDGSRNFLEKTKNKWRLLTRRKMRDVRVTFVDLSKPYILKISSSDNYKKFLNIGGKKWEFYCVF